MLDIGDSKFVKNYFIEQYDSGIICLVFNTIHRGLHYHQYNDTLYEFAMGDEPEDESDESVFARYQEIPEFLPKDQSFIETSLQNKDQIYFYFIPIELVTNRFKLLVKSF